jgi:hypothetical protein
MVVLDVDGVAIADDADAKRRDGLKGAAVAIVSRIDLQLADDFRGDPSCADLVARARRPR